MASNAPSNEPPNNAPASGAEAPSDMLQRLQNVLDQFEISVADANDLVSLEEYEMVMIVDDSGSMSLPSVPAGQRKLGETTLTRWDEAKQAISLLLEIGCCFDKSGIDVFFLNRQAVKGAKGAKDPALTRVTQAPPRGGTPLTKTLQAVAKECGGEKPVLLFILTDGEPTGGAGPFKEELKRLVKKESTEHTFKVQIMACTSDDDEIGWLNILDRELKEVDVTDDYYTERTEVLNAGLALKFNRADWVMKAMLGPISHKFDAWDEKTAECNCRIL